MDVIDEMVYGQYDLIWNYVAEENDRNGYYRIFWYGKNQ